jgi:hypothetical protein
MYVTDSKVVAIPEQEFKPRLTTPSPDQLLFGVIANRESGVVIKFVINAVTDNAFGKYQRLTVIGRQILPMRADCCYFTELVTANFDHGAPV